MTEKICARGAIGKIIEQMLLLIRSCVHVLPKKLFGKFKLLPTKKIVHDLGVQNKTFMPQKIAQPFC